MTLDDALKHHWLQKSKYISDQHKQRTHEFLSAHSPNSSCLTIKLTRTLSNGNIFRFTCPFREGSTGDLWIPLTKASVAEF